MSLFSKLFKKRKEPSPVKAAPPKLPDRLTEWEREPVGPGIPFSETQLRIIVFRESEFRGRQVLFDSVSLRSQTPLTPEKSPSAQRSAKKIVPSTDVPGVQPSQSLDEQRRTVAQTMRPNRSDVKMFGEMIFGSIPITVRSVVTKVHELRNPPQLMLTKVYPVFVPVSREPDEPEDIGSRLSVGGSSVSSEDSLSVQSPPSAQFLIPERLSRRLSANPSPNLTPCHSFSSLSSLAFSPPKSLGAAQRRYKHSRSRSIDNGVKAMLENENNNESPEGHERAKKAIVAVACLISISEKNPVFKESFHEFFFTHSTMFEYSLNIFKAYLEEAMSDRYKFNELVAQAYHQFIHQLTAFITSTRLSRPMWLIIAMDKISDESYIPVLRLRLVDTLAELTKRFDTKETQFFLSRLLTAVLSGHLGWVSTVTPSTLQTEDFRLKHEPGWVRLLARSNPYNPLWAQLGDLLGICGMPSRLTKTILVSHNKSLLSAYLHFISYFIRTSDVAFHRFEPSSTGSSFEETSKTSVDSRRHLSGEHHRSGALFNKTKWTSGTRPRLASLDQPLSSRPSRHQSGVKFPSLEGGDHGIFDPRSRNHTADNLHKVNPSKSLSGLSTAPSQTSITETEEGSSVFLQPDTDDKKLQQVCVVAAQVLMTGKESERKRRDTYAATTGDRQDSLDKGDWDIHRHLLNLPPRIKTFSISKTPDKPMLLHVQEIPIPKFVATVTKQKFHDMAFENAATFATSLMAAPRDEYAPHFALQACTTFDLEKLCHDLQVAADNCVTDEGINEAAAIIADLDNFTVKVVTSAARKCPAGIVVPAKGKTSSTCRISDGLASNYVCQILETVATLWKLKTTPEFCLMHLEDRLQELYVSSRAMVTFIRQQTTIDTKEMMELLGLEMSDFPLILAVASTHAPDVVAELNLM